MDNLIISGLVFTAAMLLLRRRFRATAISPVYGLVAVYLAVFILSAFFYDPSMGGTSASLRMSVDGAIDVIADVLWLLTAFVAGAYTFAAVTRKRFSSHVRTQFSGMCLKGNQKNIILLAGLCTVGLTIIGVGPANLWSHHEYMASENQGAIIAASFMSMASALSLGVVAAQQNRVGRRAALFIFIVILILTAAMASRRLAVLPVLFCLGTLISNPRSRRLQLALLGVAVLTPFLMVIPLAMRGMPNMGIASFPEVSGALNDADLSTQMQSAANNLLVTGPITIVSAKPIPGAFGYLLLSLNPLPGVWIGWYSQFVGINAATPYNAIGEAMRSGMLVALTYYFVLGALFGCLDARIRTAKTIKPVLFIQIALCYGFMITSLQYSLRATTRLVYYMLVFEALSIAVTALVGHKAPRAAG
jgi:hypothetical protein